MTSKKAKIRDDAAVPAMGNLAQYYGGYTAAKKGQSPTAGDLISANINDQLSRQYYEDYESIQAQVDQMKAAGLNPALMYGGSNGAGSPSVPTVENTGGTGVADEASMTQAAFSALTQGIQSVYQVASMKEQLEGLRLKNNETRLGNEKKEFENSKLREVYEVNIELTRQSVRLTSNNADNAKESFGLIQQNIKNVAQSTEESQTREDLNILSQSAQRFQNVILESDSKVRDQLNSLYVQREQFQNAAIEQGTKESRKRVEKMDAEIGKLLYETGFLLPSQKAQIDEQAELLRQQTSLTKKESQYYVTSKYMDWLCSYGKFDQDTSPTFMGSRTGESKKGIQTKFEEFLATYPPDVD